MTLKFNISINIKIYASLCNVYVNGSLDQWHWMLSSLKYHAHSINCLQSELITVKYLGNTEQIWLTGFVVTSNQEMLAHLKIYIKMYICPRYKSKSAWCGQFLMMMLHMKILISWQKAAAWRNPVMAIWRSGSQGPILPSLELHLCSVV